MSVWSEYCSMPHFCTIQSENIRCDDHSSSRNRERADGVEGVGHLRQPVVQLAGQGSSAI